MHSGAVHAHLAKSREKARKRQEQRGAEIFAEREEKQRAAEQRRLMVQQLGEHEALREAIKQANDETSAELAKKMPGALLAEPDAKGLSSLHGAAARGLPLCCAEIVKKNAECLKLKDLRGRLPLHCGAASGNRKVCKVLATDERCHLWVRDGQGKLAVDIASEWGFMEAAGVIQLEMNLRSDALAEAEMRAQAEEAAAEGEEQMRIRIAKGTHGFTAGIDAIAEGNFDKVVELLLDGDWPFVNQVDHKGRTLLHLVCLKGEEALCEAVLERDDFEKTDAVDKDFATALHLAAATRHPECCQKIIESHRCFNVNATDLNNQTPLHMAAVRNDEESYNAILRHDDCDDTLTDKSGKTAAQLADERGMEVAWKYHHIYEASEASEASGEPILRVMPAAAEA